LTTVGDQDTDRCNESGQESMAADGETLQGPRLGRYSRFYALDALRRLVVAVVGGGSAEFLSYMMQQFWCPDTTLSSPF
jgi:hypothetical protein